LVGRTTGKFSTWPHRWADRARLGLRRETQCHAALERTMRVAVAITLARPKAVSPLRSATALQNSFAPTQTVREHHPLSVTPTHLWPPKNLLPKPAFPSIVRPHE